MVNRQQLYQVFSNVSLGLLGLGLHHTNVIFHAELSEYHHRDNVQSIIKLKQISV